MLTERRGCSRVNVISDCNEIVLVDVPYLSTTGLLVNLSESGMAVQFAGPFPENGTFAVDFPLGEKRVSGDCEVAWTSAATVGIRFVNLAPNHREQIRSWMSTTCPVFTELPSDTVSGGAIAIEEIAASLNAVAVAPSNGPAEVLNLALASTDLASLGVDSPGVPSSEQTPVRGVPKAQPEWVTRMLARQPSDRFNRLATWREYELGNRPEAPSQAAVDSGPSLGASGLLPQPACNHPPVPRAILDNGLQELAAELQLQERARRERRSPNVSSPRPLHAAGRVWRIALRSAVAVAILITAALSWKSDLLRRLPAAIGLASQPSATVGNHIDDSPATTRQPVVEVLEGEPLLSSTSTRPSKLVRGKALQQALPAYPLDRSSSGIQGDVHALLTVTNKGVVAQIRILSGDPVLAQPAKAAMARWTYTPFFSGSTPVTILLPVTVRFRMLPARQEAAPSQGAGSP